MTVIQKNSGRKAKLEGHLFEHVIADFLREKTGKSFRVEGASNTKIDVLSDCQNYRLSVKNPSGKNTQVGLYTQDSFMRCLEIGDTDIIQFIEMFFGSNKYAQYSRHRLTKNQIDDRLNKKFTDFLNDNKSKIFELLLTCGHNQVGDVNYLAWATKKNDPNSAIYINLESFRAHFLKGEWFQNETTFQYDVNGIKMLHLQMKGSGKKYSSSYHSLMFHIHGNFDDMYVQKDL
jgi:hypothetical protein